MCGILASITFDGVQRTQLNFLRELVQRRGPDASGIFYAKSASAELELSCAVLSLRDEALDVEPPRTTVPERVFCWNGEAWRYGLLLVKERDTTQVFNHLATALDADQDEPSLGIISVLDQISGPYAFLLYDSANQKVFFGRDPLGRRSLMYCINSKHSLIVSSVGQPDADQVWIEADAGRLYVVNLRSKGISQRFVAQDIHMLDNSVRFSSIARKDPFESSRELVDTSTALGLLEQELVASLRQRVNVLCPRQDGNKLAILFSGGLDCTLLAVLTDRLLPEMECIDLLNVAFQNPRVEDALKKSSNGAPYDIYSSCPDRVTARRAYDELRSISKVLTRWNLVNIDVPYEDFLAHKPRIIALMHPQGTEMDLSIAAAFYFAARGVGTADTGPSGRPTPYTTTARVLLSGLGADELFGGYSRHLAAFTRGSTSALTEELALELRRLPSRNLGRDDRVIAHWGREARYPFLDENFVRFASSVPVDVRTGFGMVESDEQDRNVTEPGKRLLRLLAWKLGLKQTSAEKKRAIQFGARTAKMQIGVGKRKGHDLIIS